MQALPLVTRTNFTPTPGASMKHGPMRDPSAEKTSQTVHAFTYVMRLGFAQSQANPAAHCLTRSLLSTLSTVSSTALPLRTIPIQMASFALSLLSSLIVCILSYKVSQHSGDISQFSTCENHISEDGATYRTARSRRDIDVRGRSL